MHSHIDSMSYLPLLAAKRANVPVRIAHSHNTSIDRDLKYPLKQLFRTRITKVANEYCACGEEAGKFLFGNRDFKVIPNAIKNAFADKLFMSYEEVKGRSKRKKKQIIYSGAIWPEWFEMDIIEYLVEKFPEYEFLMLGPYLPCKDEDDGRNIAEIIKNLEHNYNIKFLGQVPHEELVSYLRQANLAIVPFVVNEVTKACSPLKCFEYLGAFLPVVSTNLPEIKNYPMIEFACSKEEFANKVEKMIDHKITENEYKMMRNFTEENTWKARSQEINNIIIDKN